MSEPWDGIERRRTPYELVELVREEQTKCRSVVDAKLEKIIENQAALQREIDRWNQTARVVQLIAVGLAGLLGALAAAWEWAREHLR